MDPSAQASQPAPTLLSRAARPRAPYVPTVGPRLKILLAVVFAATALLTATGAYLAAVTFLNWLRAPQTYTNPFTLWMFLGHSAVGVAVVVPFFAFGLSHLWTARKRPNRAAVRRGLVLFTSGGLVAITGLALIQLEGLPQLPTGTGRTVTYVLHLALPVVAVLFYVLHRRAGPAIRWKWGAALGAGIAAFCVAMVALHVQDPRKWYAEGPAEGLRYFHPSEARTADGNFIPARALMMDEYCLKCHADVYNDHLHSAHKFSSFNNPAYLFSVRQTREEGLKRDGNVRASRWCAGCHDPVPFFSGAFDDPKFDDVKHPTAHAGITCVVCHSITNINGPTGNANFTIEESQHYPLTFSDSPLSQWVNAQLIKAKPDFHKRTFLKPFHKTAEFCSTCHKVALPVELNHYKDFLRGQNHYDTFLLSGVSGHGARSFYYPPQAKQNCAECHMPLRPSGDFGSRDFDSSGVRKGHSHLFPAANTGLPVLVAQEDRYKDRAPDLLRVAQAHADFLRGTDPNGSDKKLRIDLFGLKSFKAGGEVDDESLTVLRPALPALKPGGAYLVEVVIRTVNIGHPFPQGTADSNEIFVDFQATADGRVIGHSGALANPNDDSGPVDEWAHFVNVLMLDRDGNRINRRNPQDIFTPLYDHQIPPGAAQVVHYKLEVPPDATGPVEIAVRLRYRKFDYEYMKLVYGDRPVPKLPIVDLCEDRVTLPLAGVAVSAQESPVKPAWQRWNDYGIGCLLEGGAGMKRGNLRQAEVAFAKLLTLGVKDALPHGHVNLARVYIEQGRLEEAARALNAARTGDPPAPWWLVAWFNGLVNAETATDAGGLDAAIADFERIVNPDNQPRDRGFDFTKDYVVLAKLGQTLFKRSQLEADNPPAQRRFLLRAVEQYERALAIDPDDLDSHYGLSQCYARLGQDAPDTADPKDPVTAERLLSLGAMVADASAQDWVRIRAAGQISWDLAQFGRLPPDAKAPKLQPLRALWAQLRPAYHAERDESVKVALAAALGNLHRELHTVFKPDDIARARATAEYRKSHPAANAAAEAIVIYPTHRAGAPGF
jgi:tetratricopeptide (TPR) repeat protein